MAFDSQRRICCTAAFGAKTGGSGSWRSLSSHAPRGTRSSEVGWPSSYFGERTKARHCKTRNGARREGFTDPPSRLRAGCPKLGRAFGRTSKERGCPPSRAEAENEAGNDADPPTANLVHGWGASQTSEFHRGTQSRTDGQCGRSPTSPHGREAKAQIGGRRARPAPGRARCAAFAANPTPPLFDNAPVEGAEPGSLRRGFAGPVSPNWRPRKARLPDPCEYAGPRSNCRRRDGQEATPDPRFT